MTVHFVGAGPGAADLITLRGADLLSAADVCLYPGTYLDAALLARCRPGARLVDTQNLDLDEIITTITEAHNEGLDVVRLTSGDPSLYSALAEQTRRLDLEDVPWDVTPGVPAYAAAAAVLGNELTVPKLTQTVVLTRTQSRSTEMPASEELANFAATGSTLVLHLAITRTRIIAEQLMEYYGVDCPVAVVSRVSQPRELILRGTLLDIADKVETAGLTQAALIIVGQALDPPHVEEEVAESFLYSVDRDRLAKAPAVLLFSYGTLVKPGVQLAQLGRLLPGEYDELPGYEVVAGMPGVRPAPNGLVEGTVFTLSAADLAVTDSFENGRRVEATLLSGKHAWVYVAR